MNTVTCRILPFQHAAGPWQMSADEAMLQTAAEQGIASLRFYTWSIPTLSLGYFQNAGERLRNPRLAHIPWVRRATGGAAILHDHELTYALALPAGSPWQPRDSWLCRMHHTIAFAFESLNIKLRPVACDEEKKLGPFLCFLHQTPGDLLCGEHKVVGSAQRKLRGALLQHGSILLRASEHTPQLTGIADLQNVQLGVEDLATLIKNTFAERTTWTLQPDDWTEEERKRIVLIHEEKYDSCSWNQKRP